VLGYVRHFHPSDQTELVDWNSFAAHGVRTVENAATPEDLAAKLQSLFDPIAPTVRVFPDTARPDLPADLRPPSTEGLRFIRWNNLGVYLGSGSNIYRSTRVSANATPAAPDGFRDPARPYEASIGRGLSALVPLTLYTDSRGTLPQRPLPEFQCCSVAIEDRATRLGSVILAWNVAQHFYPYFDVVDTDWPAALSSAIRTAATDTGPDDFLVTISRLWAALRDGHGFVNGPQSYTTAPLVWDWIEDQLVVTALKRTAGDGVAPGDRVLRVDGKPVEEALAEKEELISGATPQWIRYRALRALAECRNQSRTLPLEIEPYDAPGTSHTIQLNCVSDFTWDEPRPNVVQELEPGILYVDINRLTEADWARAVAAAAAAKGVIFDLRGYPQIATYLRHLGRGALGSAQWHIPTPAQPDRVDLGFERSSWELLPLAPNITGHRVFLTDGRAISFAETVMGIVEAYQLAEIVGSPTAGTNGNINYITLPGGFSLGFTGMKVLKHDGSQHHGIGIHPTIPVTRTRKGVAEGDDEVLARGIEVVKTP